MKIQNGALLWHTALELPIASASGANMEKHFKLLSPRVHENCISCQPFYFGIYLQTSDRQYTDIMFYKLVVICTRTSINKEVKFLRTFVYMNTWHTTLSLIQPLYLTFWYVSTSFLVSFHALSVVATITLRIPSIGGLIYVVIINSFHMVKYNMKESNFSHRHFYDGDAPDSPNFTDTPLSDHPTDYWFSVMEIITDL